MKSVEEARGYNPGEIIPVSCLNRTMYVTAYTPGAASTIANLDIRETGEHVRLPPTPRPGILNEHDPQSSIL